VKILLDECMPFPIIVKLADLGHAFEHAAKSGLAGVSNGDVFDHAVAEFDLFVTNDRHFRNPNRFPVSGGLGIVFVRIAPLRNRIGRSAASSFIDRSRRAVLGRASNRSLPRRLAIRRMRASVFGRAPLMARPAAF